MRAELAGINHCAVSFLSRAAACLCWYYSTDNVKVFPRDKFFLSDRKKYLYKIIH